MSVPYGSITRPIIQALNSLAQQWITLPQPSSSMAHVDRLNEVVAGTVAKVTAGEVAWAARPGTSPDLTWMHDWNGAMARERNDQPRARDDG